MMKVVRHRTAAAAATQRVTIAAALTVFASPCLADVAPESGLLLHVQPVSTGCGTPIDQCDEINRSTSEDGPHEFLLFFMRGSYSWPGESLCIESLHSELTWPDSWQLVDAHACGWAEEFMLNPSGPGHDLDIRWYSGWYEISDEPGGVIPVARLEMNVVGQGTLGFTNTHGQVELRHDCYGSLFVTYPAQVGAEAGMQCGYVLAHCGYKEDACLAHFDVPELVLSAPSGSAVHDSIGFWAYDSIDHLCPLEIDTHASWCTAWIEPIHWDTARLHVVADAAGLDPAQYETEIELYRPGWGASRCLPVAFTVEDVPTGIEEPPPAVRSVRWGTIKALYR